MLRGLQTKETCFVAPFSFGITNDRGIILKTGGVVRDFFFKFFFLCPVIKMTIIAADFSVKYEEKCDHPRITTVSPLYMLDPWDKDPNIITRDITAVSRIIITVFMMLSSDTCVQISFCAENVRNNI